MMRHVYLLLGVLCMVSAGLSAGLVDTFDPPVVGVTATQAGSAPGAAVTAGGPSGQYLRLINDTINNQRNRYSYNMTDAGWYGTMTAKFDFAGFSADQPADGFSFAILPTSLYGASGAGPDLSESASATGVIGIGFRTYSGTTNALALHALNREIARYNVNLADVSFRSGTWNQAQLTINSVGPGGNVKLDLIGDVNGVPKTVTVFDRFVFGASGFENRVQFSGRTGGANMSANFDNLNVQYSNPIAALPTVSAPANTLIQDFDSAGTTPFELNPNAASNGPQITTGGPSGNYLRLLKKVGNLNNQIAFDRVASGSFGRVEAEWDFKVETGADGMAFMLYNTGWYGTAGLAGSGNFISGQAANAFGIGFDIYANGSTPPENSTHAISLSWNNVQVYKSDAWDYRNQWNQAKTVIDYVPGGANVTLDLIDSSASTHNIVTNYFIAGMVPMESRAVFGGRTGGANTNWDLDDIQVKWLNQLAQPTAPFHWRGITGDYGTNTLWTNNVLPGGGDHAVIDVGVATSGGRGINGTGSLTVAGTGALNVNGNLEVANGTNNQGTLHLAGDSQTYSSGDFFVANGSGCTGTVTVDDNARLTVNGLHTVIGRGGVGHVVQDGGTVNLKRLFISEFAGSGGSTYTLNDGTLNASDTTNVGRTHQGTFLQTGGTFNSRELYIRNQVEVGASGDPAATATYHITGGTLNVNSDHTVVGRGGQGHFIQEGDSTVNVRRLFVAESAGSNGSTYTMMGGTLNSSRRIEVGRTEAATFTQTGGVVNALDTSEGFSLQVGLGSVAGVYNLEGGTLNVNTITKGSNGQFNFTGGRLQADTVNFALTNTSGTLAPGHSVGTTTINGGYTQLAGGTLEMELTAGGNDLLVVNGPVSLDGELLLLAGYDIPENTRILLIDNVSSDPTTGAFDDLPEGTWFGVPGVTASFAITYTSGTGNDVELTAVPEPASALLLMLAIPAVAARLRRRVRPSC